MKLTWIILMEWDAAIKIPTNMKMPWNLVMSRCWKYLRHVIKKVYIGLSDCW